MQDIGPTLREARLRAKVDISEVEAHTKIRAKYLRALENEEWDLLPGPTYAKTFLRTYAEYLGLDARLLVNAWKQRHERPSEQEAVALAPSRPGDRGGGPRPPRIPRGVVVVIALVGVVAALAVLGSLGGGGGDPNGPDDVQEPEQTRQEQARQQEAAERRAQRRRRERRQAERRERRQAERRESPFVRLQLVPQAEVWVCLQDASGERVVPGEVLSPGSEQPTHRSRRFIMTFGNGQIEMRVNGQATNVPESSDPIGFVLDRSGRNPLPEAERPTCA